VTCFQDLAPEEFGVLGDGLNRTCKTCRRDIANKSYRNRKGITHPTRWRSSLTRENIETLRSLNNLFSGEVLNKGISFHTEDGYGDPSPPGILTIVRKTWSIEGKPCAVVLIILRENGSEHILTARHPTEYVAELISRFEKRLIPTPIDVVLEDIGDAKRFCLPLRPVPCSLWRTKGRTVESLKEEYLEPTESEFSVSDNHLIPLKLVQYLSHCGNWKGEKEELTKAYLKKMDDLCKALEKQGVNVTKVNMGNIKI
jgi:hypothetical protein